MHWLFREIQRLRRQAAERALARSLEGSQALRAVPEVRPDRILPQVHDDNTELESEHIDGKNPEVAVIIYNHLFRS